jgi:hypothetical protein
MTNRLLVSCFVLLFGLGCSSLDNCPEGQSEPIRITTGVSDPDAKTFESAPWDALDHFPAKTALAFEHNLGFTPLHVEPTLSFTEHGTHDAEGGSVAPSAGNQTLIDCVDSHVIIIRNDTCEKSFYIRVDAYGESNWDLGDKCSKSGD